MGNRLTQSSGCESARTFPFQAIASKNQVNPAPKTHLRPFSPLFSSSNRLSSSNRRYFRRLFFSLLFFFRTSLHFFISGKLSSPFSITSSFLTNIRLAILRFSSLLLVSWHFITIPVGICLNWTQLDVLLIFCPPGPEPIFVRAVRGDVTFYELFFKIGFEDRWRRFSGREFR